MNLIYPIIIAFFFSLSTSCAPDSKKEKIEVSNSDTTQQATNDIPLSQENSIINKEGISLEQRFPAPRDFVREKTDSSSYLYFLRNLTLQNHGAQVQYYDGSLKPNYNTYIAVLDQNIGSRDLHQCADAIMNLYAKYHYESGNYDAIHFNFTNGWRCDFNKYNQGYRVSFENRNTRWVKTAQPSTSVKTFEKYMDLIFTYCGTASLERELIAVEDKNEIEVGDVFIKGGHPGHAIMVIDLVKNAAGDKSFLLAQSYMPAQQMQILMNPNRNDGSPWYRLEDIDERLITPEWTFSPPQLMRFSFK